MKNRFSRLISVAVMIALLLTSCVIPMSAMASGVEEDLSVDAYRYVTTTRTISTSTSSSGSIIVGQWRNNTGKTVNFKTTVSEPNFWSLILGENGTKSSCTGLPSNYGVSSASKSFSASIKHGYMITFYGTQKFFSGKWEHKRQRQYRKANTTQWVNVGSPEISTSIAQGRWWVNFSSSVSRFK